MEDNLKEFIDDEMNIISGDQPNLNPKIVAKKTTDSQIKATGQPFMFGSYRRFYMQEDKLSHNEIADQHKETPQKFYEYLKELGEEVEFEKYFKKDDSPKSKLKEVSRIKAYDVIERILNKQSVVTDIFEKDELPTIEEIKNKETLLLDKLERIAEYIKNELTESEKKVILNYFTQKINNG